VSSLVELGSQKRRDSVGDDGRENVGNEIVAYPMLLISWTRQSNVKKGVHLADHASLYLVTINLSL